MHALLRPLLADRTRPALGGSIHSRPPASHSVVADVLEGRDGEDYGLMQLHPKDTGGSFFEIDEQRGDNAHALDGPWHPAGQHRWLLNDLECKWLHPNFVGTVSK